MKLITYDDKRIIRAALRMFINSQVVDKDIEDAKKLIKTFNSRKTLVIDKPQTYVKEI